MRDLATVTLVQNLYKSGCSVSDISKKLGKSSSNVSRWCRKGSEGDSGRELTVQDKRRQFWLNFDKLNIGKLDVENSRILVSILYWCEGAKYPSSGELAFTSSDELMQTVFIKLLRKAFPGEIEEKKFRVILQIPVGYKIDETTAYWSNILGISKEQFYKPYITKTNGNRFRKSYMGTCGLRYHDYRILLRIMGAYNQIVKQILGGVR